mmetsp:Transcript_32581/g.74454  ORF Transcript_32581/g.74454 Transcript_32581/m.74454 type:complete len:261 (+) Transcript_32581:501-1283(+)
MKTATYTGLMELSGAIISPHACPFVMDLKQAYADKYTLPNISCTFASLSSSAMFGSCVCSVAANVKQTENMYKIIVSKSIAEKSDRVDSMIIKTIIWSCALNFTTLTMRNNRTIRATRIRNRASWCVSNSSKMDTTTIKKSKTPQSRELKNLWPIAADRSTNSKRKSKQNTKVVTVNKSEVTFSLCARCSTSAPMQAAFNTINKPKILSNAGWKTMGCNARCNGDFSQSSSTTCVMFEKRPRYDDRQPFCLDSSKPFSAP